MSKLYCVPLGTSNRDNFIQEALKYDYGTVLLVLPSTVLIEKTRESKVRTVSFDFLPNEILRINGYTNLQKISRRTQELVVADLIADLVQQGHFQYFEKLAMKEGFIKAITSFLGQLSVSGAKQDVITQVLNDWKTEGTDATKSQDISLLYNYYRNFLKEKNWYDVDGLYRLAIFVLQQEGAYIPWKKIYFSEFYSFNALQQEFLKALHQHCEINIGLMYETGRTEVFDAIEKTYTSLAGWMNIEKISLTVERAPALSHLVSNLGRTPMVLEKGAEITLLTAQDQESELRSVLRLVKKQLQNGAVTDDILVVLRDLTDYEGLRALGDEYGVPLTLPHVAALSAQPLTELLVNLLSAKGVSNQAVDAYWNLLNSGICQIVFNFDGVALQELKQKRFYDALIKVQVDVLEHTPEKERAGLIFLQESVASLAMRDTVDNYCNKLQEFLKNLSLAGKIGAAYKKQKLTLIEVKNLLLAEDALQKVLELLQKDYNDGGMSGTMVPLADFRKIFLNACREVQIELVQRDNAGVLVSEVTKLQGILFQHVYILGLREGEFPRSKTENWIYNDQERSELSALGIELNNTALDYAKDKYFFSAAVAMATESLTLSWFNDDKAGASVYIENVLDVFAEDTLNLKQSVAINTQDSLSVPEFLSAVIKINPNDECLTEWLGIDWEKRRQSEQKRDCGNNSYNGLLKTAEVIKEVQNNLGDEFTASKLETYAVCPFSFLVSYLWRQQQVDELTEDVEPSVEGTLLHEVLAIFMSDYLNSSLINYSLEELGERLNFVLTSVCAEKLHSHKIVDTPFWNSRQKQLQSLLLRWLEQEYEYQNNWQSFKPEAVELSFGQGESEPLTIMGEVPIKIKGRIDRIDSDGNYVFVTDYKRGYAPTATEISKGLDLQMPIYLLALEKAGRTVGGGNYFSLKECKRTGGFAVASLEKTPFTINNKLFAETENQWQAFAEQSENYIKEYVKQMRAGKFAPLPQKACSEYCPAKDICRRYGMLVVAGGEEE